MKRDTPRPPIHIRVFLHHGIIERAETLDGEPVYVEVFDYDTDGIHDGETVLRYTC